LEDDGLRRHSCSGVLAACRTLEAQGKYAGAAAVDADLHKLRRQESSKRRHRLETEHLDAMADLEQRHQRAFIAMQRLWGERKKELDAAHAEQEAQLHSRHREEMAGLRDVRVYLPAT
jgi:hypothetical protein